MWCLCVINQQVLIAEFSHSDKIVPQTAPFFSGVSYYTNWQLSVNGKSNFIVLSCYPSSLRFVDGIETENQSGSIPRFDFSPSATQSFLPGPDSATSGKEQEEPVKTNAQ